jgi:membrane associated rhomboid family serine protease
MLILPLHRPLTRATFPFVTALLIVANALVFFGWQGADDARMARAQQHYLHSELGRYEVPAYGRHLAKTGQASLLVELEQTPAELRPAFVAQRTMTDVAFVAALQRGELFDNPVDFKAWQPLRAQYDTLQQEVFTLRHLLRSSEVDPRRMLTAAFLHGDALHLIGNMLFLLALGLLVEGALGPSRFLAVYLLGAVGASAASLLWRWGEAGGGLGASGAVAALMGAFCVVWGRQPVRFFYWFGVVFDYVRAPAIWLLPVWLGWELYNLLANPELGVGFEAHAGGIVTGALLGAVLVGLGQVRSEFIRADASSDTGDTRWQRAQAHLGRMQLVEAEALLEELAREQPARFDVRLALYRVARNGRRRAAMGERAGELLAIDCTDSAEVRSQREVLVELDDAGVALEPSRRSALARRWLGLGQLEAVEVALAPMVDGDSAAAQAQAQLWFQLALGYRDQQRRDAHVQALQALVERHPQQPQAEKARFLLTEVGTAGGAVESPVS